LLNNISQEILQLSLKILFNNGYKHIDTLIISNFDQDHISDIKTLKNYFTFDRLVVNPTISANNLKLIKKKNGYITEQMNILCNIINELQCVPVNYKTMNMQFNFFWIKYPYELDTNNLSIVTFIKFGSSTILYPSDIENVAWRRLLESTDFLDQLKEVNIFIASHHGRENGYCKEVFNHCNPEMVIISDQEREFSTQNHDLYSQHARGINFGTIFAPKHRKVLTTRSDGNIKIYNQNNKCYIEYGG
jgi:beta-lactamase superfamily II metal-dependent hydrolase